MKKVLYLTLSMMLSVFVLGCSSDEKVIDKDGVSTTSFTTEVKVSDMPTVTQESTEEPIEETTEEPIEEDTEEPKKPKASEKSTQQNKNDGDIAFETGDDYKFINPDDFLKSVPLDNIKEFNKSVPNDTLDGFSDLKFVYFDSITKSIYAESDEYYFEFERNNGGKYSMMYELKEYADWWAYN